MRAEYQRLLDVGRFGGARDKGSEVVRPPGSDAFVGVVHRRHDRVGVNDQSKMFTNKR